MAPSASVYRALGQVQHTTSQFPSSFKHRFPDLCRETRRKMWPDLTPGGLWGSLRFLYGVFPWGEEILALSASQGSRQPRERERDQGTKGRMVLLPLSVVLALHGRATCALHGSEYRAYVVWIVEAPGPLLGSAFLLDGWSSAFGVCLCLPSSDENDPGFSCENPNMEPPPTQ